MQILETQDDDIRVELISPASSDEPNYSSSWVEFSDSTVEDPELTLRFAADLAIGGLTTQVVPPPPVGNRSQIKQISLHNADTIIHPVRVLTKTADIVLIALDLDPGNTLCYEDSEGWYVIDESGNRRVIEQSASNLQVVTRILLSSSTNGRPIAVAATATPGTLIHTATVTGIDEIWLWANNRTAAAATLTLEWGGTGTSDQNLQAFSIPANSSAVLIAQGFCLTSGVAVRAFSGTANALNITGHVNRIS